MADPLKLFNTGSSGIVHDTDRRTDLSSREKHTVISYCSSRTLLGIESGAVIPDNITIDSPSSLRLQQQSAF